MTTTEKNKEAIRLHVLISECYTVELINNPTHVDITIEGFISEDGDKQKQRTLLVNSDETLARDVRDAVIRYRQRLVAQLNELQDAKV